MRIRGLSLDTAARLMFLPARRLPLPLHLLVCIADHFEPAWSDANRSVRQQRVMRWVRELPELAARFTDSAGRPPQHTFFYPAEQYDPELLESLAGLCRRGLGDVEVHLHHDNDTADHLLETIEQFKSRLVLQHDLLRRDQQGRIRYGFIHGNWALNNSRPDGRWCGVDGELAILANTGCYADFTMPSAPCPNQTRLVNSIYYAPCDRPRRDAHDTGVRARLGGHPSPATLLMIQGPLLWDWRRRKWGALPRLENGDLHAHRPPTYERFQLWCRAAVTVAGRPDWVFIKLHTHGAKEANADMLLGKPMRQFHKTLAGLAQSTPGFHYYYVTAHEMAQLVHQAEQGYTAPLLNSTGVVAHAFS